MIATVMMISPLSRNGHTTSHHHGYVRSTLIGHGRNNNIVMTALAVGGVGVSKN
jgi:hypothetical protein